MNDIPPPGAEDGSASIIGDPKIDSEARRVGLQLHKKISDIQSHPHYKDGQNGGKHSINIHSIEVFRGITPEKAFGIELACDTQTPLFPLDGYGPEKLRGYYSKGTYKLPPNGENPDHLGLILNGFFGDKEKYFALEVSPDGDMKGYVVEPTESGEYTLVPISVNTQAVEPFINGMYDYNIG